MGLTTRNGLTPEDAERMLPVVGAPHLFGVEFGCVLPGYEGTPNGVVDPDSLRYQTLYAGAHLEWFSLAEVFASRTAGQVVTFSKGPRHGRWWDRLRFEAGLLDADVPDVQLPEHLHLSSAARTIAEGFALVWTLNALRYPDQPVSFARRFAWEWCGLTERDASDATRELLASGVLVSPARFARQHQAYGRHRST